MHVDFVHDLFAATRVQAFDKTTRVAVGPIDLVALSFTDSFNPHLVVSASDRFQLVFRHGPDFILGDIGAELSVAGHTHGGQVQIPFFGPPITATSVPREWAAGGHWEPSPSHHVIISRGIGMERDSAPRFRVLCPPEIAVIDLVPDAG